MSIDILANETKKKLPKNTIVYSILNIIDEQNGKLVKSRKVRSTNDLIKIGLIRERSHMIALTNGSNFQITYLPQILL